MTKAKIVAVTVVAVILLACAVYFMAFTGELCKVIDLTDFQPSVTFSSGLRFGLGYAVKGYASIVNETGADLVRIPLVAWGWIEPSPPVNGVHCYNWTRLDELIREYQESGFDVQIIVKTANPWACTGYETDLREMFRKSYPPKDEYWDDYYQFIYNLVERYDGDGYNDMPGLLRPVLYYEIESEAHNPTFWAGTIDDYRRLLKTAYTAAKQANPEVKIILSGINFGDFFNGNPSPEKIEEAIDKLPPWKKQIYDFIVASLGMGEYYDIIDIHFNRDYRGIKPAVEWVKRILAEKGCDKPIWAGDVCSVPWITDGKHESLVYALLHPESPEHEEAEKWLREEQAKLTVKKLAASAAAGLEAFILETIRDFSQNAYRNALKESFIFAGLVDENGKPRPAFYAYKQAIEKIRGYYKVEYWQIDETFVYKFYFEDRAPVYVAWSENEATVILHLSTSHVRIEPLALSANYNENAKVENVTDGKLSIKLSSSPIFIEELADEIQSAFTSHGLFTSPSLKLDSSPEACILPTYDFAGVEKWIDARSRIKSRDAGYALS